MGKEDPKEMGEVERFRQEFLTLLDIYLPSDVLQRDMIGDILDVGCGFSLEVGSLHEVFPQAKIVGIDFDPMAVRSSQALYKDVPEILFVGADLRDKESFGDLEPKLIVIRNPNAVAGGDLLKDDWKKVFNNAAESLASDGFLLLTAPARNESSLPTEYLTSLGLQPVLESEEIQVPITANLLLKETVISLFHKASTDRELPS